jgi:hypothetical protein
VETLPKAAENRGYKEKGGEDPVRLEAMARIALLAVGVASIGCGNQEYELIERSDHQVPNFRGGPGTHMEVLYVLYGNGRKVHASCDVERFASSDPSNTCRLMLMHKYSCEIGSDGLNEGDLWNMRCKDFEGHNVYLYSDAEELR